MREWSGRMHEIPDVPRQRRQSDCRDVSKSRIKAGRKLRFAVSCRAIPFFFRNRLASIVFLQ
jgi:hypothetical protein